MVNKHNQVFFGQSTAVSINSSEKEEPYVFLKCFKKKQDGSWEKPSQGEGKTIRLSLEEMVMILKVLKKKIESWITYHVYKEEQTQITIKWENEKEKKLWIHVGNYSITMD